MSKRHKHTCEVCKGEFKSSYPWAKYCGSYCRNAGEKRTDKVYNIDYYQRVTKVRRQGKADLVLDNQ